MTQPAKVQEPSMEEILASIRRIIADDEAKPVEKDAGPPASAASSAPGAAPPGGACEGGAAARSAACRSQ
jgi:cell pole-organizing protein PopZ